MSEDYKKGFNNGLDKLANDIRALLDKREVIIDFGERMFTLVENNKIKIDPVEDMKQKGYDFYYSRKQTEYFKVLNETIYSSELIRETTVDGVPYTEMILKGNKPVSNFDDLKLVYSANVYKINIRDL